MPKLFQTQNFSPTEVNFDPTNKLRTSSPQALIDTDFEYGTQVSKWENIALTNNRPFAYADLTTVFTNNSSPSITSITATTTRTVTVVFSSAHGLVAGDPIIVQDTYYPQCNGTFSVDAVSTTTVSNDTFTYTARSIPGSTGSIYDPNKTQITKGLLYTGAAIGAAPTITTSGNAVTVTTTVAHGLNVGNEIMIKGITGTNPPNGSFIVARVVSPVQFIYYSSATPSGLTTTSAGVFARPPAAILHRPFDGGVIFSSNGTSNYESAVRQTRRYFRYQSGKGIQFSSGTILKPNFQIDSLTSDGSVVTVKTKDQHNIQTVPPDTTITVFGANEAGFNGTYQVTAITGYNSFTYTPAAAPGNGVKASGNYYVSTSGWWGAVNRLGIFDQQNGLFFEFDGQQLYAVRRNSTYQISGRVDVSGGSNTVTASTVASSGFPTVFAKQLTPGDYIVIKGQSYRVDGIADDSTMTISPGYRGATASGVIVSKTIDTKYPQSSWNLDRMDGTGNSGFKLDLTKMQMFYIDYSWYGAGFIRWGLRGADGNVTYVHKVQNNNVNQEAYMRTGNLPGRYETATIPPVALVNSSIASGDTVINVPDASKFPTSGTLLIKQYTSATAATLEHVYYSGRTNTQFQGISRAVASASATPASQSTSSNILQFTSGTMPVVNIGQRVVSSNFSTYNDGTFVVGVDNVNYTVTISMPPMTGTPVATTFVPMSGNAAQTFTYSTTRPITVELAYPTLGPTISHWGTSVIMDGRFDDDKSLLFTYGMTTGVAIAANASRALFSIRVAPSVDNGRADAFGSRELINRMQLVLRSLDVSMQAAGNLLVTAVLNGTPNTTAAWAPLTSPTSSLAQIATYSSATTVSGGEVTGGFFVGSTGSIDLSTVRDLGNSILGGGSTNSNAGIFPDGPDTLTIVVTNVGTASSTVLGRIGWTEAQA
jgi:hypothetical protein